MYKVSQKYEQKIQISMVPRRFMLMLNFRRISAISLISAGTSDIKRKMYTKIADFNLSPSAIDKLLVVRFRFNIASYATYSYIST